MKNTVSVSEKPPRCAAFPILHCLNLIPLAMSLFTTLPTLFQKRFNAFLLLFWLWASMSQAQTIRYVKPTATGAGDGTNWANASGDLQGMINASGTEQVWVAAGIYKPTTGSNRNASFSMKAGVKIYGSFAGGETALSQRTATVMANNKSILSGDLNGDDATTGNGENCYHVIFNNKGLTTINSQNSMLI